jgi:hypothetical protein
MAARAAPPLSLGDRTLCEKRILEGSLVGTYLRWNGDGHALFDCEAVSSVPPGET